MFYFYILTAVLKGYWKITDLLFICYRRHQKIAFLAKMQLWKQKHDYYTHAIEI